MWPIIREGFLEEEECVSEGRGIGQVRELMRCWGRTEGGWSSLQGETSLTVLFPLPCSGPGLL